jgi:glycosyltransferase involved in cell wall biosynthesis
MDPLLSVIIPTRDRPNFLLRSVELLLDQAKEVENRLEIIVVDDGSKIDISTPLHELVTCRNQLDLLRIFHQSPSGPAVARNLAIKEAKGSLILFLGDDIFASPGLLRAHIEAHTQEYLSPNIAILGMADFANELNRTPFTSWWRLWNFRYWLLLENKRSPDYSFFYTNNLSVKRSFLLENGLFDESFPYPAYEDTELGVRLFNKGMQLVFKPYAQAVHWHEIDLKSACQRMLTRGRAYDLFIEKTHMMGISRLWKWLGTGPWMQHWLILPLYRLADWLQTKAVIPPLFILVLMYNFQVGRGKNTPLPGIQ